MFGDGVERIKDTEEVEVQNQTGPLQSQNRCGIGPYTFVFIWHQRNVLQAFAAFQICCPQKRENIVYRISLLGNYFQ